MQNNYFRRGSSAVDWCESNYVWTPNIAEFFNTISNLVFFIMPPILINLYRDYAKHVTNGIQAIFCMILVIGVGSVYFHSTLTMAGQLMDELSILWVMMMTLAFFFPHPYLPIYFQKHRGQWYLFSIMTTLFVTYLCFLNPYLNAYCLMMFAAPFFGIMMMLVSRTSNMKIIRLARRTFVVSAATVMVWAADRALCDLWLQINTPYFHSLFHVLAFFSAYYCIVILAYFTADNRVPHLRPSINYWPSNNPKYENICLPYVQLTKLPKS